ncbi:MAG: ABC transporter permease subunit [Alicyclobacillus sp.]|nr:ABC transporter permease subunit [Alicyclobacillus sp.]
MDVPLGQREAATALGLGRWLALRKVIVPQAFALMLPAITSFVVLQLKNTTLLYLVGYADIMYEARLGKDATSAPGVMYLMAAVLYLVMSLVIGRLGDRAERRAAAYR